MSRKYHVWTTREHNHLRKLILDTNFEIKSREALEEMVKAFPQYKEYYTYHSVATKLSDFKVELNGKRISNNKLSKTDMKKSIRQNKNVEKETAYICTNCKNNRFWYYPSKNILVCPLDGTPRNL